jgi:hypothetical protein
VAAIGFRCKILQSNSVSQDFSQNFIVSKMLEGMKRTKSSKDSRLPITLELLTKIIDKLSSICFSSYEALLFAPAFTFAFHGFLRVGEIVYTKPGQAHQIIGLKDVTVVKVDDLQSIKVRINHSKKEQIGKGVFIYINETRTKICPLEFFNKYIAERPSINGPLFCHFNGKPMSRYQLVSVLNKALEVLGIDASDYNSHSFRIGAASLAAAQIISNEEIMKLGRWKSNAFKSYIRS